MDTPGLPAKISRIDKRFRYWAQDFATRSITAHVRKKEEEEKRETALNADLRDRANMGRHHVMFHRRQTTAVLTVNVQVINSIDSNGRIIAQQTVTPNTKIVAEATNVLSVVNVPTVPTVPTVPAVPTNGVPTVPPVPPFPSDLTVPGYPFTSSGPATTVSSSGSQVVITPTTTATPLTTSLSATSLTSSIPLSATPLTTPIPSGYNSTASSTLMSSTSVSSSINSTASSSQLSSTQPSSTQPSSTQPSSTQPSSTQPSSSTSLSSSSTSASFTSTTAPSSVQGFLGGGGSATNTALSGPATSAATSSNSSGTGSLGTPEVVGTVFGSLAGAALLLVLVLFLLRRHKQKQRAVITQSAGDDHADNQPMTQAAARSSYLAPSFLNRFSGASRSTTETASTGERGFQRISGRKLPSAFSEGMTSEQFAREGTLSGSSFYKDDRGIYGGPGINSKDFAAGALGKEMGGGAFGKEIGGGDFDKETGASANVGAMGIKERVMPGPARTPVVFHPEEFSGSTTLSPPLTPNPDYPPTRGTLGRSHPSHDGSRSSRFTENV